MALKTVMPYDLRQACEECGVELCDLVAAMGLSEDTLLAFSRGEIGLSATDRLCIILFLIERSEALPDEAAPWRTTSRLEALRSSLDGTDYRAQKAERKQLVKCLGDLYEEAEEEGVDVGVGSLALAKKDDI